MPAPTYSLSAVGSHQRVMRDAYLSQLRGSLENCDFVSSACKGHGSGKPTQARANDDNMQGNFGFGPEGGLVAACWVSQPLEEFC